MPAKLISKSAVLGGVLVKTIDRECTIGRGPNTITVPDSVKAVSSSHVRIWFDGKRGCYMLEDKESLNGTELDGVALTDPEPLGRLHVITLGQQVDFIFQDLSQPAVVATAGQMTRPSPTDPTPPAPRATRPDAAAPRTQQETVLDANATRLEWAAPPDATRVDNSASDPRNTRLEGIPGKSDES